jgi:hypothetical protein
VTAKSGSDDMEVEKQSAAAADNNMEVEGEAASSSSGAESKDAGSGAEAKDAEAKTSKDGSAAGEGENEKEKPAEEEEKEDPNAEKEKDEEFSDEDKSKLEATSASGVQNIGLLTAAHQNQIRLNELDCTFNSRVTKNTLMSLQSDGFDSVFAACRTNFGVKSGRYYWEAKMLDQPQNLRVGVSGECGFVNPKAANQMMYEGRTGNMEGHLFLESQMSIGFDSNGNLVSEGKPKHQFVKK